MPAWGGVVTAEHDADEPGGAGPEVPSPTASLTASATASPTGPADPVEGAAPMSFADLYVRSFADMVRLARVLVDSPETAEDLVQDAFVRLHRRWTGVREPHAYLRRCVVNACRSHHRRAWRERSRPGDVPRSRRGPGEAERLAEPGEDWPVDGLAEQSRADDAGLLVGALGALPYRQRAALVLRYYADLPDADIAVALGCRPGTVPSLVHRGLDRLRGVLRDER